MSAFEAIADRFDAVIGDLTADQTCALLWAASSALEQGFATATSEATSVEAYRRRLDCARAYLTSDPGTPAPSRSLPLRSDAPEDLSNVAPMALSAWICCDSMYTLIYSSDMPPGVSWYLLEPQLAVATERLYGLSDVGSERASDERRVVESPYWQQFLDDFSTLLLRVSTWHRGETLAPIASAAACVSPARGA